ncbi:UNVERIFIED_CONTAM: hypothetical protein Slati_1371400 [Sesamum latifolium]|uniref:Uncharacterized protein n=1 Tax=Sesamum latifolium TaxID=2727402 RepID=A0AAW2XJI9_9LAMI
MSSTDKSARYVGESRGDDPFEATSRRLGSPLPSYVAGRRWSLRQAARRLLDESSEEEEGVGEEEGSSPGRWSLLLGRRRFHLGIVGAVLRGRPGSPVVLGNWTFTNWWRSSPFSGICCLPFSPRESS